MYHHADKSFISGTLSRRHIGSDHVQTVHHARYPTAEYGVPVHTDATSWPVACGARLRSCSRVPSLAVVADGRPQKPGLAPAPNGLSKSICRVLRAQQAQGCSQATPSECSIAAHVAAHERAGRTARFQVQSNSRALVRGDARKATSRGRCSGGRPAALIPVRPRSARAAAADRRRGLRPTAWGQAAATRRLSDHKLEKPTRIRP